MFGAGFAMRSGTAAGMRRMGVSPSTGFWPAPSVSRGSGRRRSRGQVLTWYLDREWRFRLELGHDARHGGRASQMSEMKGSKRVKREEGGQI